MALPPIRLSTTAWLNRFQSPIAWKSSSPALHFIIKCYIDIQFLCLNYKNVTLFYLTRSSSKFISFYNNTCPSIIVSFANGRYEIMQLYHLSNQSYFDIGGLKGQ